MRPPPNLSSLTDVLYQSFRTACCFEYIKPAKENEDKQTQVTSSKIPPTLHALAKETESADTCLQTMPIYTAATVACLEKETCGQSDNSVWIKQRKGQITGSVGHVLTRMKRCTVPRRHSFL